jgi:putative isomerase
MPLLAGIPTKKQAARMAEVFATPAWQTPVPVPTIPGNDPRYDPKGFWRGDIWTVTNYQIAKGLKAYGFDELAANIADKTIENSLKNGVSEHHNSQTGEPLGVGYLGMSCTVVTLMLEGISKKYKLKISKGINPLVIKN